MIYLKFEKQVKEAKRKQLESRIVRDIVFLVIGITFLLISIFSSINDKKNNDAINKNSAKQTSTINR